MKLVDLPAYAICLERKPPTSVAVASWRKVFPHVKRATAIDYKDLDVGTDPRVHEIGRMHVNHLEHSGETVYALPSKGAIACALSHYALCKIASRMPHGLVVIEQDVEFTETAVEVLKHLTLPADADYVSLLYIQQTDTKPYDSVYDRLVGPRCDGNQCYFISAKGAIKTLKRVFPIATQCDLMYGVLANNLGHNFCGYVLKTRLYSVWQILRDNSSSTIQKFRIKKYLPRNNKFYYGVILILVILLAYMMMTL